jgi:hypothetical protein
LTEKDWPYDALTSAAGEKDDHFLSNDVNCLRYTALHSVITGNLYGCEKNHAFLVDNNFHCVVISKTIFRYIHTSCRKMALNLEKQLVFVSSRKSIPSKLLIDWIVWPVSSRTCMCKTGNLVLLVADNIQTNVAIHITCVPMILWTGLVLVCCCSWSLEDVQANKFTREQIHLTSGLFLKPLLFHISHQTWAQYLHSYTRAYTYLWSLWLEQWLRH